ncbi:MAG: MupA/Atu3671 family FMN-dependent luciferase-like monooxygenase, partial [Pseudomonadota bacterium]
MSFSTVLVGQESLLIACGDMLLDRGHSIRCVVSDDADIQAWAHGKGLQCAKEFDELAKLAGPGSFDWLLSIANLRIIPQEILKLPTQGAINFHDGPLPRYAGLNCPAWALMNAETEYGVTWHIVEAGLDTGDILIQPRFAIDPSDTAFSLNSKCYGAAMDSFPDLIAQLETGVSRHAQDLAQRQYYARDKRPPAAGHLDFTKSAESIVRTLRALDFGEYWNPLTTAKFTVGEIPYSVSAAAEVDQGQSEDNPGQVLQVTSDSLSVMTGKGAVALSGVTRQDGRAVDLSSILSVGDLLSGPDPALADTLSQTQQDMLADEHRHRDNLRRLHPLPVPLATDSPAGDGHWITRRIERSDGLDRSAILAGIAAWALASSGEDFGDLAVASAPAPVHGYVSQWVPVQVRADDTLEAAGARLWSDLSRAKQSQGFALDLVIRDPQITTVDPPQIGLTLDDGDPILGTCLTVSISDRHLTIAADTRQIDTAVLDMLADRLTTAIHNISNADAGATLGAVPVLPESEKELLLNRWNATHRSFDRTQTVHGAFEAQVARTPDTPALVHRNTHLSYAQLNARANAIASSLIKTGVSPGQHVGLHLSRSVDLVAAALAVLKAGGAYVPLDPDYPKDRIAHYIADSQASVIVAETSLRGNLPDTRATILDIGQIEETPAAANVEGGAGPGDLAYLIYTSGSTGTPKGVMVEHRNVMNFFSGMDDHIGSDESGNWMAATSLNFDISVLELFWTLTRGFKVILSSDEHRAAISKGPIATSDRKIDFNLMYWGNDDGPGPKKYELLLEGAKFADAHGFNAVWTPERHFHAFGGPYPNPAVTGAAVAAVTQNLSVRAGSCVAPLHHPARIAEDWAVIDNLTAGRAALAIASGWQPDDFILRPENAPPNNKPAMFDAIETLRRLWRGERVEFPRADGSMHGVVTQPRPVSKELPIWVTTAGNPETWRDAGRTGANVLTHLLGQTIDEVAGKISLYHEALREAGHDPADFRVTLMLHSYLADSREAARKVAREPMKDYLRSAAGLIKQYAWAFPAFKRPEGVKSPFEMDLESLNDQELDAILDFAFERYFEESGLFGTIEDGLARVEQLKRIGVDEVACLIDYGIDPDVVLDGLKPLAEVLKRSNAEPQVADDDFSLAAQIIRHDVTHMQCTPSMARMIALNDEARMALGRVRHILLGGEALPGDLVADLRKCTDARFLNMYGPTETTIWSTTESIGQNPESTVNVGCPIANTSVYVLDQSAALCPVGVPGELYIGGEGVTRGYWQRVELTQERFPIDPFANGNSQTSMATSIYRTGDLVRWRADGKLDFLGRTDHQIKIRGQRIELGEIEHAMKQFSGVSGAVVVARTVAESDTRLIGYVTSATPVDEADLRTWLSKQLPEVMVPAHIISLQDFPLTPNKKIDRNALPDPKPQRSSVSVATTPKNGAETRIAEIWSRILGVTDIRSGDNFFELGGHSLLAVQAHREIRAELDLPSLSITDIFRFPTLAGLSGHVAPEKTKVEPEIGDSADRGETISKRR